MLVLNNGRLTLVLEPEELMRLGLGGPVLDPTEEILLCATNDAKFLKQEFVAAAEANAIDTDHIIRIIEDSRKRPAVIPAAAKRHMKRFFAVFEHSEVEPEPPFDPAAFRAAHDVNYAITDEILIQASEAGHRSCVIEAATYRQAAPLMRELLKALAEDPDSPLVHALRNKIQAVIG